MSCAPRSSRWPGSWSCSWTRTSTRTHVASSSRRCASRSRGCRSSRWTCSTSLVSTPARSSWRRSLWTLPSWLAPWSGSSDLTMREQVARLQKLSVNLLDLSRLDAGSVELQTEPVDLAELARSVVGEFGPAIADHGTELNVELPEAGPSAQCDRERVAQIMRILLDNALRHTPEGTDVTVRANGSNGAAELTVADTGPGLPDGTRAKVFERFFTGDAGRGAGLGLAIARELAERMDGRLVLSTEQDTTAFTLELPADGNGA